MRHFTVLRLLLAAFLLYFAWPYIPLASSGLSALFWAVWLGFLLLVVGGNLATLLQLSEPPVMEQETEEARRVRVRR